MKTFLFLFLFSLPCFATDSWYCSEESGERKGSNFYACGVGTGDDEEDARSKAFDSAREEFRKNCELSEDCHGRAVTVNPQRTTCEKTETYKCYRLIVFSIGTSKSKVKIPALKENTRSKNFTPFKYESIAKLPKVKIGMTKNEILKTIGRPEVIRNGYFNYDGSEIFLWQYNGDLCETDGWCTIQFNHEKVMGFQSVKLEYTEALK